MRKNVIFLSAVSALALAGCKAGDVDPPTLALCGLSCPPTVKPSTPTAETPVTPVTPGVGTTGVNTTGNTGNTTNLNATDPNVDKALAMEISQILTPTDGSATSFARLTETPDGSGGYSKARIEIDTGTQSNSNWPPAKDLAILMSSPSELGGASYREYHKRTSPLNSAVIDEELQVWQWANSRAYQYRHVPNGGEAINQLWGYGGQATALAEIPTAGTATYNGRFAATAKTWNWTERGSPPVVINNLWRVSGRTNITANFTTNQLNGTLTPEQWNARDQDGVFLDTPVTAGNWADVNHKIFMTSPVTLKGTITGNTYAGGAAFSTPGVSVPSTDPLGRPLGPWITNDENIMHGGFYGTNAAETTGTFALTGTRPDPTGGDSGINSDGRSHLKMSGVFHGQ
jgi:C-lobe and N-lobe beta barrels of Tf-binding protein B